MTYYVDIDEQTTDYRGVFGWNAFTQPLGNTSRPAIEIELFIKEHSVPVRKKKLTEINSVSLTDPVSQSEVGTQAIFEGSPEILTVTLSGWVSTPIAGGVFTPKDKDGNIWTAAAGLTYAEIVSAMLEGQLDQTIGKAYRRKDPDYFISPYGHKYTKPIISVWEAEGVASYAKKQAFNATLLLEK